MEKEKLRNGCINMTIKLTSPFTENKIRKLKVGDMVEITGKVFTARDAVHQSLHSGKYPLPVNWKDQIIYHCGPVVIKENDKWVVKAAGPTTSIREEPYEYNVIKNFGVRGIIGKGGMGARTLAACKEFGCVYLHAIGGAAQIYAAKITNVNGVYLYDEVGAPEAIWDFEVKDFPVVVTMDSNGSSLHDKVLKQSTQKLSLITK
jgi:fumarate hydratase class I